jgi:hypothetical protein
MSSLLRTPLLVAVLVLALYLPACNRVAPDPPLDPRVSDDLRAVPADARAIGYVSPVAVLTDLRSFASAVDPELAAAFDSADARLRHFLDGAALDPARDLESVVVWATGARELFAVARGTFDAAAVTAALDASLPDSARRPQASGIAVWTLTGPRGPMSGAVLPPDRLVAATGEDALLATIDRLQAGGSALPPGVLERIGAVAGAPTWGVGLGLPTAPDRDAGESDVRVPVLALARAVRDAALEGRVENEVAAGSAILWPREGVSVDDLEDLAEGVKAALLLRPEWPDAVRRRLEDVDVRTEGSRVRISGSMSAATLRELADL